MAIETMGSRVSAIADGDLRAKQFQVVTLSAGTNANEIYVKAAATTDEPFGILQNNPNDTQTAEVMLQGLSKFKSNDTLAMGAHVMAGSSGLVTAATTNNYIAGTVVMAANAGEIGTIKINAGINKIA